MTSHDPRDAAIARLTDELAEARAERDAALVSARYSADWADNAEAELMRYRAERDRLALTLDRVRAACEELRWVDALPIRQALADPADDLPPAA